MQSAEHTRNPFIQRTYSLIILLILFTTTYMVLTYDSKHWTGLDETNDSTILDKLSNRAYISAMIFSTVGFGDISPKTRFCKTIVNVHLFLVLIGFISFFTLYDRPASLKPIHLGNIRLK